MEAVEQQQTRPDPRRMQVITDSANRLADARRTKQAIADLAPGDSPTTIAEAYVMQDLIADAYGAIGGWKIGAATADATPGYAPMPAAWIAPGGATVRGIRYRGLEAEVAFLLGQDLPPRPGRPYTRDEVLAAIASCHPAVEILESAFANPTTVDRLSMVADLQMHGAFVYGPPCPDWRSIDWSAEQVTLAIDGTVRVERTGSNTAGDLLRLLPWLANEATARTRGLHAGQWITTGSWTGNTHAEPRTAVDVRFQTLGRVTLLLEPEQELEKGLPGSTRSFT